MKKTILILTAIAFGLVSCSDDDENNGLQQQSHDDSAMMDRMHAMMTEMEGMTMTHDPEIDFINMMIMHHEGAIDMANLELEDGNDATMMAKAQSIITEQQQEIQELQTMLADLTSDDMDMTFSTEMMMSMDKMGVMADTQLLTGDTDHDFATLMMVHHNSAVEMASAYLHHGSNPELSAMATMMVDMQNEEIIELGNWLLSN